MEQHFLAGSQMNSSTIGYIGGLFLVTAILGCSPVVDASLDPNQSNNLRRALDRISISDDGLIASSNGKEIKVSSFSDEVSIQIHASSEAKYSPLISPDGDRIVSVRFSNGNWYADLDSLSESSSKSISFSLGRDFAVPMMYFAGKELLLVEVHSSDGIGQGILVQPGVLDLSNGSKTILGNRAVADPSGTHLLVSRGKHLYKAMSSQISRMTRLALDVDPKAISRDGSSIVARDSSGMLHVIDLATMAAKSLGIAGHSAFFAGANDRVAVVTGSKNSITIVDAQRRTSTRVTNWDCYNSLPVQSSNGRYFAFERFDADNRDARTIFVYDNVVEELRLHSTR